MRATTRHALIALAIFTCSASPLARAVAVENDPSRIAELAATAASGDWRERTAAIDTLRDEHGAYAVNGLLRWIGSQADVERRVQAIYALRRLGAESVLALAAGLHSDDAMVRRNICIVLSAIGDERVLPSLACIAAHDEDELTREKAAEAISRIGFSANGDPAAMLADLARRFRTGELGDEDRSRVFFWNGKAIGAREVPPEAYGPAYGKVFAEDALRVDPTHAGALSELIDSYVALQTALGEDGGEDWNLARLSELVALGGHAPEIEPMEAPEVEPVANADGMLGSNMKEDRYAAALSLAASNPSNPSSRVVETLGQALSESAIRQVLVIHDDPVILNELVAMLRTRDMFAVGAKTGAMGLMRAKAAPVKDAIVMSTSVTDVPVAALVSSLDLDVRTKDVPIIVLGGETEVERVSASLGDSVAGVVPMPVTLAVLQPALDTAFEAAQLNDQRMQAADFSRKAAQTLASLDGASLAPAADAIVAAIGRDDDVQIPALKALAKAKTASGQAPAAALFSGPGASTEARVAAAEALAGIVSSHPLQPGTRQAMVDALAGDDAELRVAAARVLGAASTLSTQDRAALMLDHSLEL